MATKRGFGRLGISLGFIAFLVFAACLTIFWFRLSDSSDYQENTDAAVAQYVLQLQREGKEAPEVDAAKQRYIAERQSVALQQEEDAAWALYAAGAAFAACIFLYPLCWLVGWTLSGFASKD